MKVRIGLVDDQQLFLKSLGTLINTFPAFEVMLDAMNGENLLQKLESGQPEILLIDVNMPVMDGPMTARKVAEKFPAIKMVALSMKDDDKTVISMLRAGCCAYLLKDIHPDELEKALQEIHSRGFYNADACNVNYRRLIIHSRKEEELALTEKELIFLQQSCSDRTYKQIAAGMYLSERTIDGYRESLFQKLKVQSRVGMVLEGLRRELISLDGIK